MKPVAFAVCLLSLSPILRADSLPTGTWVRRELVGGIRTSMTVEAAGAGKKITYNMTGPDGKTVVSTVLTQFDGKDAPQLLNGQPTGQTMAIREIDSRHASAVLKFEGKETGTSSAEVSLDGKLLTVENTMTGPNGKPAKSVEHWDKK